VYTRFFSDFLDIFNIFKRSKTKTIHDRTIKMEKHVVLRVMWKFYYLK